ncbi:MAG: endolytic transglycosylase MltG [Bacteroidales bacterium]|nr:endolytic transglycosylase MltG [Bacteroidales bacterium]
MKQQHSEQEIRRRRIRRIIVIVFGLLIVIALVIGYRLFQTVMKPSVRTPEGKSFSLYVPTGASYDQVLDSLKRHDLISDLHGFEWLAQKKSYPEHIHPGHYLLKNGMSNNQLINMLTGGLQTPVKVTFNNMRDVKMLAGRISQQIEADSLSIVSLLTNPDSLNTMGFNTKTIPALFLPNTYEFYWNTSAKKFVDKMHQEYDKFWNAERLDKAKAVGLTPIQVSTLASIVDKETNKTDEMARIAGVYLNRLRDGWMLQADPTLVFAVGDFELKRVLNIHKEVESPYNTYKYAGLPPGPICIPSLASINAVLNPEKHNYYYFCAKEDFSGYHNFAKTLSEHTRNAERYQRALRER